jgi:DNA-binding MarR family transcriptional regulator
VRRQEVFLKKAQHNRSSLEARGRTHESAHFSLTGNDRRSHGGFSIFSAYLLTHPLLSTTEKVVLQYLVYRAESYEALAQCRTAASLAGLDELAAYLHLDRKTVRSAVGRLEELGLIARDRSRRQHVFLLLPGPWPHLGDRPERGFQWRDVHFHGDLSSFARSTMSGREGGAMFLNRPKKGQKKVSEEIDSEQGNSSLSTQHRGNFDPPISSVHEDVNTTHNTPQTENTRFPSRARGSYNIDSTACCFAESGQPAFGVLTRHGERPAGSPQDEPPQAEAEDLRGVYPTFSSKPAVVGVIQEHAHRTPSRDHNPVSRFKTRYRQRVEDDFDISVARFTAGQTKQVKQTIERYGAERTLAALNWIFDNWPALKRQDGKIYAADKYPPLRALTAANLMDRYMPYVDAGEAYATHDDRYHWEGWTERARDEDDDAASVAALREVMKR